jgi:hypothetical protein
VSRNVRSPSEAAVVGVQNGRFVLMKRGQDEENEIPQDRNDVPENRDVVLGR